MNFLIADTFTDSLTKLTGDEQKSVKTTAFDLQMNPTSPGLRFHKLDRAKDPHFWSVSASMDIRLITTIAISCLNIPIYSLLLLFLHQHILYDGCCFARAEQIQINYQPK